MVERFHRRSIRLRGYDYTRAGAYYVTVCTHERLNLFGRIVDGVVQPSPLGVIVQQCWDAIPERFPHVDPGEFVAMPNHVHGIVVIGERSVDAGGGARDGAGDVGARQNAPQNAPRMGAGDARGEPPDMAHSTSDDGGNGMPGGGSDADHAWAQRTGARSDAPQRDPRKPPGIPPGSLGHIMQVFKSAVTRMAYRDGLMPRGAPVWQRNYYETIIRDQASHERIARYIHDNPANWERDRMNRPLR